MIKQTPLTENNEVSLNRAKSFSKEEYTLQLSMLGSYKYLLLLESKGRVD